MKVSYQVENEILEFELNGKTFRGPEEVLLYKDINLLQNTPWNESGYTVVDFTSETNYNRIKKGITDKIARLVQEYSSAYNENFSLEKYHEYVNDETHLKIARNIHTGWHVSKFPIDFNSVEERMSKILGQKVSAKAEHFNVVNNTVIDSPDKKALGNETVFYNFNIRIARPGKFKDNNPPHRDVWLDRLRNAVNIYMPLSGSNEKSSLPLIPGSHLLKESAIERTDNGAHLGETQYTVPCVISINGKMPQLIRPKVLENEIMIFSPYLVHGGGYNLNKDKTRVSLEIRFWKCSN